MIWYIINCCKDMREWLSGGAPPCQGGGRGFDPRLALVTRKGDIRMNITFFLFRAQFWARSSIVSAPLRSAQNPRSTGPLVPSRAYAQFWARRFKLYIICLFAMVLDLSIYNILFHHLLYIRTPGKKWNLLWRMDFYL